MWKNKKFGPVLLVILGTVLMMASSGIANITLVSDNFDDDTEGGDPSQPPWDSLNHTGTCVLEVDDVKSVSSPHSLLLEDKDNAGSVSAELWWDTTTYDSTISFKMYPNSGVTGTIGFKLIVSGQTSGGAWGYAQKFRWADTAGTLTFSVEDGSTQLTTLTRDAWHTFQFDFDMINQKVTATVDGTLYDNAGSGYAFEDTVADLRYGRLTTLINTWNFKSWVDDVEVTTIPEPATVGVLALGGVMWLIRRKRK